MLLELATKNMTIGVAAGLEWVLVENTALPYPNIPHAKPPIRNGMHPEYTARDTASPYGMRSSEHDEIREGGVPQGARLRMP
ncbi:hypothetical protein DPEC_G00284550 [Dallia pectoralis]|uniref:Uncharacterized protein n=1 Tax=Dallia pectoralis TaxID=75939 RepID=A0ACC2FJN4_DALPE|nr:hypothetical protein DPEC_G00284550 [Dallia pectoralis]